MNDYHITMFNSPHVTELFEIMKRQPGQAENLAFLSTLIGQVNHLQGQLNTVTAELRKINENLQAMQDSGRKPLPSLREVADDLKGKVTGLRASLVELKTRIVEGAKKTVAAFKQKGISALDKAMKFFNVKDKLAELRKGFDTAVEKAQSAISRIDLASAEYHEVGRHFKNIWRAAAGKELIAEPVANGKLSSAIKAPFQAAANLNAGASKAVGAAIGKVEQLEGVSRPPQPEEPDYDGYIAEQERIADEIIDDTEKSYEEYLSERSGLPADEGIKGNTQTIEQTLSPAQAAQVETAKNLIPDERVVAIIDNPYWSPEQMETLIKTACGHPDAGIEPCDLSPARTQIMNEEIFDMVNARADAFATEMFEQVWEGYGYSTWQAAQIKEGIKSGVNISKYADPTLSAEKMLERRKALEFDKGGEDKPSIKSKLADKQTAIEAKPPDRAAPPVNKGVER